MRHTLRHKSISSVWLTAPMILLTVLLAGCNNNGGNSSSSESSAETKTAKTSDSADALPVCPVVKVEEKRLDTTLSLPGNLEAFQDVPLHAKVEGYITWIGVDRGSHVKKGQELIKVAAPELDEKVNEAIARINSADSAYRQSEASKEATVSKAVEAKAKLDSDELTYTRLAEAAQTPGAVAQNDVDMAQKTVEADRARVHSVDSEVKAAGKLVDSERNNRSAARSVAESVKAMKDYLTIVAPFDGVITERNVHEGSIVAIEASRMGTPLVRIQEEKTLRLVVAVPEASVAGIKLGTKIPFTVPAFAGKTFYGIVARPAYSLEPNTRTMPVELSVDNANGELEPGMFATVLWQINRPYDSMFLPQSAVATDLKGTFVVRLKDGVCERVPVTQGSAMGSQVEVTGKLTPGDEVALKATDEMEDGNKFQTKLASAQQIRSAGKKSSGGGGE